MNLFRGKTVVLMAAFVSVFFGSALFASGAHAFPAITWTDTIAEGRAAATETITSTGASSISLALVYQDQVVWAETFGLADKDSGVAPTADTMYGIGSTSKLVAAIAVMRLVDQKRVALDGPVTRYIKSFTMTSPKYKNITVRQLLNHSSGFPGTDYRNAQTNSPFPGYLDQVFTTLSASRLKNNPGYMNVYCNDGFTVLEKLISSVTGLPYTQFVQDEVFTPLGMEHSRYPLDYFPYGAFANTYSGGARQPQLFGNVFASGGLYSTPTDLAKLAIMLIGDGKTGDMQFLSRASVAAMTTDQTTGRFNPVKSYAMSYGLGLDSVVQPGLRAVHVTGWHKGGDIGAYSSTFLVAPKERLAAVVMGASGSFSSGSANVIAERILLRALVERGRIKAMPAKLNPPVLPVRTPLPGMLASIGGNYALYNDLIRVEAQPDKSLNISMWNTTTDLWDTTTGIKLRSDGWFATNEKPGAGFSFIVADGRRYLITRGVQGYGHYQDDSVYAQKIASTKALPTAWANRLSKKWLVANEKPEGGSWDSPLMSLKSMGNLLFVQGQGLEVVDPSLGNSVAGMMLLIPQANGRDLNDLVIETRSGEEWARLGSYLYRPKETVQGLNPSGDTVTIGSDGLAQWRSVTAGADITVSVVTKGPWRLYSSDLSQTIDRADGTKSAVLPAGNYYMVFHANATITTFPVSALQAMLDGSVSDAGLPGAILAIRTPTGSWVGAGGKASLTTGELMTPDMQVRLASVTKPLTAMLVMKLAEATILNLSDTVEKWLPGLLPSGNLMTIKMLLSHRAGVANVTDLSSFWTQLLSNPVKSWSSSEIVGMVHDLTPVFTPGDQFSYSNTGYYVLGLIVEAATGNTLAQEIENRILGPQGLTRTRLDRDGFMYAPSSHGHTWLPTTTLVTDNTDWNLSWDWTAGAGVSTGAEMLKLASAFYSGGIVNPITVELMTTPTEPGGYGLGIGRSVDTTVFNTTLIGHTGENPGTVTYWYYFPDYATTIFVAANRADTVTHAGQTTPIDANALTLAIFTKAWQILHP